MKENTKWLLYNLTVAFTLYWAGNLFCGFPGVLMQILGLD